MSAAERAQEVAQALAGAAERLSRAFRAIQDSARALARRLRAFSAILAGKHELADVILTQPGRRIVREGMIDVLHWLGECRCRERCDHALRSPAAAGGP